MKISIDTATDSPLAIRKAMELLGYLANNPSHDVKVNHTQSEFQGVGAASLAQEQTEELSAGFSSMFGDASTQQAKETPDTAPNFGSFLNLVNGTSPEDKKDPKIEFF